MQFDWTTFALEILNFLVLLWILTRFLYRPVLGVIDARRDAVRLQEESVQARQRDADAAKSRYEALAADQARQREQAQQQLQQELAAQRAAGLDAIRRDLDHEREQAAARAAAAATTREAELARHALENAYRNVASMLRRLAAPELTARIVDVFLEDLGKLSGAEREKLLGAAAPAASDGTTPAIAVATAHALDEAARRRLSEALAAAAQGAPAPAFAVRPDLIAGVRVALGQWSLKADLAGELAYFMERDLHG